MKKHLVIFSLLIAFLGVGSISLINDGVVKAEPEESTQDNSNGNNSAFPMPGTDCPEVSYFDKSKICDGETVKSDVIPILIITILNWALVGVGTVVTLIIVIGGIMYMTAAGDTSKAKNGTKMIQNALLALVLYLIMITFLNFIIPGGFFAGAY